MIAPELILKIVTAFYAKATHDFLIGYHFRNIDNFDTHIPRIAAFWEIQLNGKTNKKEELPFNLMAAHAPLGIKKGELGRWVQLFNETLNEHKSLLSQKEIADWSDKVDFFKERLEQRLIRPS